MERFSQREAGRRAFEQFFPCSGDSDVGVTARSAKIWQFYTLQVVNFYTLRVQLLHDASKYFQDAQIMKIFTKKS